MGNGKNDPAPAQGGGDIVKQENERAVIIQNLVLEGDLSKMSPGQRVQYYNQFCQSLGLNPLTQPFRLIKFQGKLIMYATKDCTEQLRKLYGVSITEVKRERIEDIYVVYVTAKDSTGRTDVSTGALWLKKDEQKWNGNEMVNTGNIIDIKGSELANLFMKAETKAKRRVTLSICGLGMLDETELEDQPLVEAVNMEELMIDEETIDKWRQSLEECKTPDEVDQLASQNVEVGKIAVIRKMFVARKDQLRKPSTKEKADRAVNDLAQKLK